MTTTIGGTTGVTFPDASTQNTAATGFGFKNRIINGAMMIDQRNAGASVTPTNGAYTLDRYAITATQASKISVQQNAGAVTPPVGFTNYLGVTSLSAYSVVAADVFRVIQFIEGFNTADLSFGSANASAVTLSFWVRSSLTGTFGGALQNGSAPLRSYPFTYTINAANTWEQKSVTISGDTSGTWLTTNGIGIRVEFGLGVGSTYSGTAGSWSSSDFTSATGAVSVVGTSGATFYITGVQLEKGSTATSFDYRPYGTELQLCQRYFEKSYNIDVALGTVTSAGSFRNITVALSAGFPAHHVYFAVAKRASPTVTVYNPTTGATGSLRLDTAADVAASAASIGTSGCDINASASVASGNPFTGQWAATIEL